MTNNFNKIAAEREKRKEIYELADYEAYTAVCPDHPGVRWTPLSAAERKEKKLGQEVAWKCPVDGKVYVADGSVGAQVDGFAQFNNLHNNNKNMNDMDEGEKAVEKLTKEFTYPIEEMD